MGTPSTTPAWDDLRVLLAVHRHRSFLAAGRALAVSTSTVARRIGALEAALGRPLVHRGTSGAAVDADAAELVALAEQLELGLDAVRRDDGESDAEGTVRVSMGEGFVQPATRVLAEVRRAHPRIQLEIVSETRLADLVRREADFGIRKVRASSPALIQRTVGRLRFALYTSQDYLERRLRGARLRPADFARHDFIAHERALRSPQTEWLAANGAARFALRANSDLALIEATVRGMGISVLVEAQARDVPGLVRLDVDAVPPPVPVYLLYHRELRQVARYRIVARALEAALRSGLA